MVTTLAAAGWIVAAIVMLALWRLHFRIANAGIVDVGWTGLVGALTVADAAFGQGAPVRRAVIAGMVGVWSARLLIYLLRDRVLGRPEDARYDELRASWGSGVNIRMFFFFQTQALAAVFFTIPALLASVNPAPSLSWIEISAVGVWIIGFVGESTADRQLEAFKTNPANRGRTCQLGLWRLSRHPNYFFEWVMWVAYALFATASPWGWLAWLCPAAMLYLLLNVTGIAMTEAHALRSRGEEYRRYQETTSGFVPWFPRRAKGLKG